MSGSQAEAVAVLAARVLLGLQVWVGQEEQV
jgi:hypothetical protein